MDKMSKLVNCASKYRLLVNPIGLAIKGSSRNGESKFLFRTRYKFKFSSEFISCVPKSLT